MKRFLNRIQTILTTEESHDKVNYEKIKLNLKHSLYRSDLFSNLEFLKNWTTGQMLLLRQLM